LGLASADLHLGTNQLASTILLPIGTIGNK